MVINIFISFREIDRQHREGLEGTLKNPNSKLKANPISSREDIRHHGEIRVKRYIKSKIEESDIVLCLIGNDSHNSKWIDYEIDVATSKKIPIIGIKIPGTNGSGPSLFKKRKLSILNWIIDEIKEEIEKYF